MTKTLSPLYLIEETVYQKVKDKAFHTWHYVVALAFLTVIPTILSFFLADIMVYVLAGVVAVAWLVSRVIGRTLSRKKGIDSVLIYRYFAAAPWVITVASTSIALLVAPLDSLSHLFYSATFWMGLIVLAMHILGIVIHHYKSKKMIRNVKKEDLFQ